MKRSLRKKAWLLLLDGSKQQSMAPFARQLVTLVWADAGWCNEDYPRDASEWARAQFDLSSRLNVPHRAPLSDNLSQSGYKEFAPC
jgi:hypothetical protein